MRVRSNHCRKSQLVTIAVTMLCGFLVGSPSLVNAQDAKTPGVQIPPNATPESLFADFLHYARIGQFTAADAYARALLAFPNLDPSVVHDAALKDQKSVDTLMIIIKNSSIGDNAAKVLDLVKQGEYAKRKNPDIVRVNVNKLGGDPQQEWFATERLADSGEYAIPELVQVLHDPVKKPLWPRVIKALPRIGKDGVGPLVMALNTENDDVRNNVIRSLGQIGYPQALPYLLKVSVDDKLPVQSRDAALAAIEDIQTTVGRDFPGTAAELFHMLAVDFYNEADAVRADERLPMANVWYWDATNQILNAVPVPTRVFGSVMAMRCSEEALKLKNDQADSIALWLAANIRREGRLGMNVESGDAAETGEKDATRPAVFPRALYFSQAAGPRYTQLVLDRANQDRDSAVALGAIEALRLTAGEASLFGSEVNRPPLASALEFPDLVVRIRAALALGGALPTTDFVGSPLVVQVLGSALTLSGREQIVVVDADPANLNRVVGAIRAEGREVIGESNLFRALERARIEFQGVSGLYVSANIADPDFLSGARQMRNEFMFAKTPTVVLTKPEQQAAVDAFMKSDANATAVPAGSDAAALASALAKVRERTKQASVDNKSALAMSIQAAQTLQKIGMNGRTALRIDAAEPALIASLQSTSEELQTLSASVLSLIGTPTAQRAIAHVALDPKHSQTLRVSAYGSLAESGKRNGLHLEDAQVTELIKASSEEADMVLRTAASKALGALDLRTNQASDIIRSYYGG